MQCTSKGIRSLGTAKSCNGSQATESRAPFIPLLWCEHKPARQADWRVNPHFVASRTEMTVFISRSWFQMQSHQPGAL